jgi:hypothetical protein
MLGGPSIVGRALGLSPSTISRWYMPLPTGRGGMVPSKHIHALCDLAQRQNIPLEPNAFFPAIERAGELVW